MMTRSQARGGWRRDAHAPTREFEAMRVDWRQPAAPAPVAPFQATYGAVYDEMDAQPARSHSPPRFARHDRFDGQYSRGAYQPDRFDDRQYEGHGTYQPDRFDDRAGDRYRREGARDRRGGGGNRGDERQSGASGRGEQGWRRSDYGYAQRGAGDSYRESYRDSSYASRYYRPERTPPPFVPRSPSRAFSSRSTSPEFDPAAPYRAPHHSKHVQKHRDQRPAGPPGSPRSRPPFRDTFELKPPRPLYVAYSCERITLSEAPVPKLLVLDLNGALVYRTERGASPRTAYPRPFLANFLSYLFGNDRDGRGYEVLVWSSAQPHNVRNMVESTFEAALHRGVWEEEPAADKAGREARGESRLLDVWARDKMGLSQAAYGQKVQTVKDLRKVTEVYSTYDEKTTVLLDDSPLKAMHQPWSEIIIPEFDKPEFTDSRSSAARLWEMTTGDEATPTASDGSTEPGMDNILLGVIGILEALRGVDNVPAWVRTGHLHTPKTITQNPSPTVTLDDLPSHESFVPWFKDAAAHTYWVERGREALARRGIPVSHGLMPDGHGATPERIAAYERAQRGRSESRPIVVSSDGEVEEAPEAPEAPQKAPARKVKPWSKKKQKQQRKKMERFRKMDELAQVEGANAEEDARVREDSVADEPRDDVPPGAEPAPFFVQKAAARSTVASSASSGRSYSTRAATAAQTSQAAERAVSPPAAPTHILSPSPEREERAYSPSMPV